MGLFKMLKKILTFFKSSGLWSVCEGLYNLFDESEHSVISREGWKVLNNSTREEIQEMIEKAKHERL